MQRRVLPERPDWRGRAAETGFVFHSPDGTAYWDESAAYAFTLRQIEDDLEEPGADLVALCYDAVERIIADERLLARCGIPTAFHDLVTASWRDGQRDLYGRFDLRYDGKGPAKLYEYNADTPTSLFEAAVFQWLWLEDQIAANVLPKGSDQFNAMQERLIEGFGGLNLIGPLHLTCARGSDEDRATTAYLEDCAQQAGLTTRFLHIDELGVDATGRFVDLDDAPIANLFKLYPWEWLFAEQFGTFIAKSRTQFIEPPWKAVLSSKALLPLLWQFNPGHPNLLPAFFADDPQAATLGPNHARKPIHGREGANVHLATADGVVVADGPYGESGWIVQDLALPPTFDDRYPVLGLWIVAGQVAGLGIREDASPITGNNARFMPHFILP
jgi:glutathionylspermidine synthase